MKRYLLCSLLLYAAGYTPMVFSAEKNLSVTCNTLAHVYEGFNIPISIKGNNPEDLTLLSKAKRYKAYHDIIAENYDEYDCESRLFETFNETEKYLLGNSLHLNEQQIRQLIPYYIPLPAVCLAYRDVYIKRITPKINKESVLPEYVTLIDIAMVQVKYNGSEKRLSQYCNYAKSVWERDPYITQDDYQTARGKYPLTPFCEKAFSESENITFNDFGPEEKDKRIDGLLAGVMRARPVLDVTASGIMEKRFWLWLLYKNDSEEMDRVCHINRINSLEN